MEQQKKVAWVRHWTNSVYYLILFYGSVIMMKRSIKLGWTLFTRRGMFVCSMAWLA